MFLVVNVTPADD